MKVLKKIMKIMGYILGIVLLLFSLIMLFNKSYFGYMFCIIFLAMAIIVFPIFELICILINRKVSFIRKVFLEIGTFFLPLFVSVLFGQWTAIEDATFEDLLTVIITIVIYWIAIIFSSSKTYIDLNSQTIMKKSENKDIFHKLYNKKIEKHNVKVEKINAERRPVLEYEQEIRNSFGNLDVLTVNAIANMVSETNERYKSTLNEDVPEINISDLVMSFCKDTQRIENEYEFEDLYTPQYYTNKINEECFQLSNYIKSKIKQSIYDLTNSYINVYDDYIKIFMENMEAYVQIKFYRNITLNHDECDKYKDYGIDENVDYTYKDCFIYLIDLLATCSCISKMLFIERKVNKLDTENEFYKIINNMVKEIKDIDTIIKKSRPIFDEFYKSDLGFIIDDLHYEIAITIIVNKINNNSFSKKDETILDIGDEKINNLSAFDSVMKKWITTVADRYRTINIERYVILKVISMVDVNNFDLYFKVLSKVSEYTKFYNFCVEHNKKISDRERYLNSDFEKEKKELSGKYSFNNITSGTQFELYLVNLFKDLGYKVKHNGKSGDQGCDLIVKKNDYIYAIQAKYYTGKLSNTPVQEISSSLKYYNANQGVVVTNSSFTLGAEELAKANNVILIDGKDLKKLIDYTFEDNHDDDFLKNFDK